MRIPTLGDHPHLSDVFNAFPESVKPLLEYHDILLRAPSPLSVGERELIAAFVSGLNSCHFCYGAHKIIAEAAGIPDDLFEGLIADIDNADISDKLKPIFRYVKVLTESPSNARDAHTQAIRDAGWDDRAIHDTVAVCALFNLMNRLVEGMGVETSDAVQQKQRQRNSSISNTQYQDFGRMLGIISK